MAFSFLLSHAEVLSAHVHGRGGDGGLITSVLVHFEHLMEKTLKGESAGGAGSSKL